MYWQIGDYPATEHTATEAIAQFDLLRGRGNGMWMDQGVTEHSWLKLCHQRAFDILCEAHKRLAYETWLVEVQHIPCLGGPQ